MESLRLDTLAAQVVAWHNRHPLARRISPAQVQSVGYLVLPGMQATPAGGEVPLESGGTSDGRSDVSRHPRPATALQPPDLASLPVLDERLVPAAPLPAEPPAALQPSAEKDAETDSFAQAFMQAGTQAADGGAPAARAQAAAAASAQTPAGTAVSTDGRQVSSLRERLAARTPQRPVEGPAAPRPPGPAAAAPNGPGGFRLSFSETVLEHTRLKRLNAWAQQQARVLVVPLPARAAVSRVPRDAALSQAPVGSSERPVDLLLRTATLALGKRRVRLLIGPGDDPAVLGPRLWSLPRLALASLPLLLLPVTAGTAFWLGAQSARPGVEFAAAPAKAAPAHETPALHHAEAASAAGAQPAAETSRAAFVAMTAPPAASAAAATEERPDDVEPTLGRVELPSLGPLFTDPNLEPTRLRRLAARTAEAASAAARTAAAASAAAPNPGIAVEASHAPAPTAVPQAQAAAAPPPAGYAISTRLLRTEAEAEQIQAAMRTLLAQRDDPAALVQRVPMGDDWRVMGGPFGSRAVATRVRAQLLARGVKTEVIEIPPVAAVAGAGAVATAAAAAAGVAAGR